MRQIAESLREFGWMVPILIDGDNEIIAGHGRLEAAKLLGQKRVPVIVRDDLTEPQRRAYLLADNRLAESAEWDKKLLALEVGELELIGFDLTLTGFTTQELQALVPAEGGAGGATAAAEPELPDLADDVFTELGDTWLMGKHRLACGDSTKPKIVSALLDGGAPTKLMVADPPYGVEYDPEWRNRAALDGKIG
ncbi:MAG: ParB/Srx family N-terminal domain-containing protein, partial [Kiloniellales bacterium]